MLNFSYWSKIIIYIFFHNPSSPICVVYIFIGLALSTRVWLTYQGLIFKKKTDSPSLRSHKQLGVGACESPPTTLDGWRTLSPTGPMQTDIGSMSLWSRGFVMARRHWFALFFPNIWLLLCFYFHFHNGPLCFVGRVIQMFPFVSEQSSDNLKIDFLGVYAISTTHGIKMPLWWCLRAAPVYWHKDKHLEDGLGLCPLQRSIIGSPLWLVNFSDISSWEDL